MSDLSVAEWLKLATPAELMRRVGSDPGLMERRFGNDGFTIVHEAAALGRTDLLEALLPRGISVDGPSGEPEPSPNSETASKFDPGYTPLMAAAAHGQVTTVRFLLRAGGDPDKEDYNGGTAVHSAVTGHDVSILNLLLAAGCDPDAICGYKAISEELGFYWVGLPCTWQLHGTCRPLPAHSLDTARGSTRIPFWISVAPFTTLPEWARPKHSRFCFARAQTPIVQKPFMV